MTEYDLAQRERIRETLLAYMKEHKIGVPRLAARIKEAVHRNPEIPVKTLQRFMKGEVRTIDMHVGFLAQFVEKVSRRMQRRDWVLLSARSILPRIKPIGPAHSQPTESRAFAGNMIARRLYDQRLKLSAIRERGASREVAAFAGRTIFTTAQ